jgi:hypothetical protein
MKLLLDQNLSYKLCRLLADLFPDSAQVRRAGLAAADDSRDLELCSSARFHAGFLRRRLRRVGDAARLAAKACLASTGQSADRGD